MKNVTLHSRYAVMLLLIISLLCYAIDYLVFGHAPEIAPGFLGNFAFLPIYVLFVTLVIERVIKERERSVIRQKLNMVIGLFYSEVGTELVRNLGGFLNNPGELTQRFKVTAYWSARDFKDAAEFLKGYELKMESKRGDLYCLREYLMEKRGFSSGFWKTPTCWNTMRLQTSSGRFRTLCRSLRRESR